MPRRKNIDEEVACEQPASLTELAPLVKEFYGRLEVIQHEIETLNEDKKTLVDEYSDRLDIKMLKLALRAVEIRKKAAHKDAFDNFVEILERD